MRILCISDTHGHFPELNLEGIDLVLHAGDLTYKNKNDYAGQLSQFENEFCPWVRRIWDSNVDFFFTWGNHETFVEKLSTDSLYNDVTERSLLTAGYHTIYKNHVITGFEWTPYFYGWGFNAWDNEEDLGRKCKQISPDTHILLSHGPPRGILDLVNIGYINGVCQGFKHAGSIQLLRHIQGNLQKLKLCVFGHLHASGGLQYTTEDCVFVNASYVDDNYIVIDKNRAGVLVEI